MQTENQTGNNLKWCGISRALFTPIALLAVGTAVGILTGKLPLMLTATAFAGALALLLTILRPDLALILFFCGVVMMTDAIPDHVGDFFALPDIDIIQGLPSALIIFFLVLLGITMMRIFLFEKRPLPVSPVGLGLYAVILLLALLTGLFGNGDRGLLHFDFMKMLFPVLCFYLCLIILNSQERIRHMLAVLLTVSALKALVLAAFYLAGHGWPYDTYRIATQDSADLLVFITLVLIVIHLLVRRDVYGLKAGLFGAACIPLLFAIVFAYRRAQWIGMAFSLSLLYLGAAPPVRRRLAIILAIVLCVASAFAVVAGLSEEKAVRIVSRITSIFDKNQHSNEHHLLESKQVLQDLSRSPLLGMGLGGHHSRLPGYNIDVVPTNVVHNTFLYIWMKLGLPGLLFFIWVSVLYARRIFRLRSNYPQHEVWSLLLPLAASSGLWLAMFLTGPTPWYFHQTFLLALFAAMGMSLILQADNSSKTQAEAEA